MSELEEKYFYLSCKYEIAFETLLSLAENNPAVELALNRINEIAERQRRREAMREPEMAYDTF